MWSFDKELYFTRTVIYLFNDSMFDFSTEDVKEPLALWTPRLSELSKLNPELELDNNKFSTIQDIDLPHSPHIQGIY